MLKRMDNSKKYIFISILIHIAEFLVDSFATLYLVEKGATYTQIGLMWAIYLGTTAITDYPTGGMADKFGRRKIYACGIFLTSISYFLMLSNSLSLLYISYSIKGLGESLISGSLAAWLSCALNNHEKFKETIAKRSLLANISSFVLPIILMLYTTVNMTYVFLFSAIAYFFVAIFTISFLEENYGSQEKITSVYQGAVKCFINDKGLVFLTLVNVSLYMFFTIFYYVWQPIANSILSDTRFLPVCYGVYTLFVGGSSYFLKYIQTMRIKKQTIIAMVITSLCFLNFYVAEMRGNIIYLLVAMMLFGISGGVIFMLVNVFINEHIPNEYKASTISLISSICTIANVVFQIVFGKVVDEHGLKTVILCGMAGAAILAMGLLFVKEFNGSKIEKQEC